MARDSKILAQKEYDTTVYAERGDQIDLSLMFEDGTFPGVAPAEQLDPHIAKQAAGYYGIHQDLADTFAALTRALDDSISQDRVVQRALLVHAIVAYNRCFAAADGRGVKLDATASWIDQKTDDIRWHNLLRELRNQVIAHAGLSPYLHVKAHVVVDQAENPQNVLGIYYESLVFESMGQEDIRGLLSYVERLRHRVDQKSAELTGLLEALARESLSSASGVQK